MAKFLFCLPRYHTNSVPWSRILLQSGHQIAVDVAAFGPSENWEYVTPHRHEPGWLCKALMGPKLTGPDAMFHMFPGGLDYWRHLKRENPDVVIVRGVTRWFPRIAAACALLQGRRLIIYDQEDVSPRRWSGTWLRRAMCRLIGIPHVTPRLEKGCESGGLGDAIALPFGSPFVALPEVADNLGDDRWPPKILMVGKYRRRKGHAKLLEAMGMVADQLPFSVTFCGEVVTDSDRAFCTALAKQAATLGIADRLRFRDNVPHSQMWQLYQAHDIVILPSWLESGGMSPVEGAWSGCAVLVSHDLGTRGYFPPGPAYHFNPQEPADIARALMGILATPMSVASARAACYTHVARVASDKRIVATFESFVG